MVREREMDLSWIQEEEEGLCLVVSETLSLRGKAKEKERGSTASNQTIQSLLLDQIFSIKKPNSPLLFL